MKIVKMKALEFKHLISNPKTMLKSISSHFFNQTSKSLKLFKSLDLWNLWNLWQLASLFPPSASGFPHKEPAPQAHRSSASVMHAIPLLNRISTESTAVYKNLAEA
jgi:hypothetical protein